MSHKSKVKASVLRKNQGPKKPRGFQCIDPEKRREIARQGGKASAASGKSHKWDSATAKIVGKKGGLKSAKVRREAMKARKLAS
jgi:general stress protein YciG